MPQETISCKKEIKKPPDNSSPGKSTADACPQLRLGAHRAPAAGTIILAADITASAARLPDIDVASTSNAAVSRRLVTSSGAEAELVIKRKGRTFVSSVGIASTANAAEEAAGG